MRPASDWKRLFASLVVSCLLHAALFFMPYLGVSTSASRLAEQGGQKLKPPRTLNATLALEKKSAFAAAEVSPVFAEGESMADSSAERMASEEPRPALNRTEGIGLLPIPAPTYYTTDQLTKRPQPTAEAELDAPEIRPILASGTIILKLWISELGGVIAVDVEKTDLPEIFSRTAVAAFRNLRFVPGEINGRPVGTMMRIEVTYDDGRKPPP
jgi:outer membrane biosynthesis protein TonB